MDDTVLISTVTHLTCLGVLYSRLNIRGNSADFRVRHQAAGTKNLAQLTNNTHGVRSGDNHIEIHVAFFDFFRQVIHTNNISTGSGGFLGVGALGEYRHTNGLASTVRQNSAAAHNLV